VPRDQIRAAAALGGVAVNGARAIGPALAGFIIAWVGPGVVFAINAATYFILGLVLLGLRPPMPAVEGVPERFASAIRPGQRYVRNSLVVRRMLLRVGLFVLPGAALWALLPLVASRLLRTGSAGYGLLLAALGAGAVLGADLLPRLHARLSSNGVLLIAGAAFTTSLLACVVVDNLVLLAILLGAGRISWLAGLMTVTGALQVFLPGWVRARGLSMFNIVFAGGQAIGAFVWGLLAQWAGLVPTFVAAASLMAIGTATVAIWPLRNIAGLNRDVAVLPVPVLAREPAPEEGPVLVTLSYTVERDQIPEFLDVMARLRRSRLRTGASSCELFQDGTNPFAVHPGFAVSDVGRASAPSHRTNDRSRAGHVRSGYSVGDRATGGQAPVCPTRATVTAARYGVVCRRSAIVTSPAAQCVGGTSRMMTRTLSDGASIALTTAAWSSWTSVRSCCGVRPSVSVTSTSGTSAPIRSQQKERFRSDMVANRPCRPLVSCCAPPLDGEASTTTARAGGPDAASRATSSGRSRSQRGLHHVVPRASQPARIPP
jgi:MFS family permease